MEARHKLGGDVTGRGGDQKIAPCQQKTENQQQNCVGRRRRLLVPAILFRDFFRNWVALLASLETRGDENHLRVSSIAHCHDLFSPRKTTDELPLQTPELSPC
jgi:hypothetical protein